MEDDRQEESDVKELLSNETGVPIEIISRVLCSSDDAETLLLKFSEYATGQRSTREKLRSNIVGLRRARVNADQQFNQLEKQLISCNTKLEQEIKSNESVQKQLEETTQALEGKTQQLLEAETIKENFATNCSQVSQLNENLEAEKLNLIATVERKNKEIDRLNGEWESMFEKNNKANSLELEAKAKLDELRSKETSYQLRENRLEQEKDLLKKQNDWLDSQLKEKSEAFFSLQKEKSSSVQRLQSGLDSKIEEVKDLESLNESLQASNEELKEKVNSFMEKLKDARELQSKTEEQYKLEVSSQSKLTMLYKDAADASKVKCDELVAAVEELQKLLKEASNARLEAESSLKESETNYGKTVKEYDEKIESLQNELRNANDLLEAARKRGTAPMSPESLAALSPTAAATSSFLKSGMTLTQIYNNYVETLDSLHVEQAENSRLKEYLNDILQEMQEKAPLFVQQRKDYENALDTVDKLSGRLEMAMVESERFSSEASDAVAKSEHVKRENERMKILAADLGNQVKVLLKECEEARGTVVSRHNQSSDEVSSSSEVLNSSEVISEHLVTFRSIEELQEQNQKLLTVVRELSEEKEEQEKLQASELGHSELKKQLDDALGELEELKASRAHQAQMVEAVVRQRDMYKVLLSNTGQSPITSQGLRASVLATSASSSVKEQSQSNFEETNKALKELQKQFESYKSERLANEKLLQEKNEEMRSAISDLNIKNATLLSQVEHANERYKLLESTANNFKKEAEALRDKSNKLSLSYAKLETSYEATKQEVSEIKEKLMKKEVMYENLRNERSIIKEAETRLAEENKSLINQQKGQSTLITNLQTIQNNLERQEYETRTRLTAHVESLEREVTVLKQRLTSAAEHQSKLSDTWESQVKDTKQKLETEIKNHQESQTQLQTLRNELDDLKAKYSEKESHLSASETRLKEILERNAEEDQDAAMERTLREQEEKFASVVDELKERLSETESRNKLVENQLELATQHVEQYKAMLSASEEALTELNKTSKLYQDKMESEQAETQTTTTALQADLQSAKATNAELEDQNRRLQSRLNEETASLRTSVQALTADLKQTVKRAEESLLNEKRAKEICAERTKVAAEAQEKYQKELMHHATDVAALTVAKEQVETFNARIADVEEKCKAAESNLASCQASWEERTKVHAKEVEKLVSRCGELVNQNSLLHEQGEKLSQQVLVAQSRSPADIRLSSLPESSEQSDNKAVNDLWEIIRFLRQEKEIAETKSELVQSERARFKQRLEYVEKQLNETEECLEKERKRANISAKDSKEHDEIMEKVQKLGEVEEQNKVLTGEKEMMKKKISLSDTQIKKLEREIGPLKENIKSLTSQKDMLVGEKTGLKNEITRWRTRTNQLMEQCKQRPDPEDMKKLQDEKKQLQDDKKQLLDEKRQLLAQQKISKDEVQKSKVQVEALRNEITRLQAEINMKKNETAKLQEEINTLKSQENYPGSSKLQEDIENLQKELESKNNEYDEKVKTINQLKKLARSYKSKYDGVVAEKDKLASQLAEEKTSEETTDQESVIKALNKEKKTLQDEVEKLTQECTATKEKEEKAKKTLSSATKRIHQLVGLKDKYVSENKEIKENLEKAQQEKEAMVQAASEREMRLSVLSTQFEGKQTRLERELKEKNEELEQHMKEKEKFQVQETGLRSEIEKLKKQNEHFQRVLRQAQQKIKSQASLLLAAQNQNVTSVASTSTGAGTETLSKDLVTSQSASAAPPTAAVKPTATPSTSVPVRPVSTPTASIRPMAMTTAAVQPTPIVTVPPTVTTQPTAVAIVSAVSEPITATSVALRAHSSTTTIVQSTVTPPASSVLPLVLSEATPSPSVSVRPIASSNVSTVIAMATSSMEENDERPAVVSVTEEERPSTVLSGAAEESASDDVASSRRDNVDVQQPQGPGFKRSRDAESVVETSRESEAKRAKTDVQEEQEEGEDVPVEDEEAVLEETEEDNAEEDEGSLQGAEEEQEPIEETGEPEEPEIVCIDSDDDDAAKDDVIDREIAEGDDDDIVEVIDDDMEDIKEEFVDEEIGEEPEGSTQEETNPNVPVVLVTADSTPSTSTQERRTQETAVTSNTVPSSAQVRLIRSQSHLAPFTLSQGQPGNNTFDDTDDCMVPSTPTLFIPKRSDGFGEMISSPRVQHPSFSFGPSADTSLTQTGGLAMGMSEEGLRVDDTRFDIMASSGDAEDADLGFDNVVPDLDEGAAIEFVAEDESGEGSSSGLTSMVSSTSAEQSEKPSTDISEQNVPETSDKYETIEIPDLAAEDDDDGRTQDDNGNNQAHVNLELETSEKEPDSVEVKPSEGESSADLSKDAREGETSRTSTPEPPSSTSGSRIPTTQEAPPRSNVVQLRRPAAQTSTRVLRTQNPGVQAASGRRMIRRVQGRGQARGTPSRGRGRRPGPQ